VVYTVSPVPMILSPLTTRARHEPRRLPRPHLHKICANPNGFPCIHRPVGVCGIDAATVPGAHSPSNSDTCPRSSAGCSGLVVGAP
jgi:hypothetical protein